MAEHELLFFLCRFEAALRAGKHVFVEKPLSLEVATCEALAGFAAAPPAQVVMVGFEQRFDPDLVRARGHRTRRAGPAVPAELADLRPARPQRLLRALLPELGRHLQRLQRARHRPGPLEAGESQGHQGVRQRHQRGPPATRATRRRGYRLGLHQVRGQRPRRAVPQPHGNETTLEVIGTEGMVQVGSGAQLGATTFRSAQGVHPPALPDFYVRYEQAFLQEMRAFLAACQGTGSHPGDLTDAIEATRFAHTLERSFLAGETVRL